MEQTVRKEPIPCKKFKVRDRSPLYTSASVLTGNAPTVTQFAASATSVSVSVSVFPTTTTYTLYAANAFGQTTSSVSVTIH